MAFGAQVKEQRSHSAGAALPQLGRRHQHRCVFVHVFAFICCNSHLILLMISFSVFRVCSGSGRSELDELQEEVARRARQQEQQKRREAEREVAMGFNPKPSKFMDLDQLQHQGMEERGSEGGWRRKKR